MVRLRQAGCDGYAQVASAAYDALVVYSLGQLALSLILLVVFPSVPFDPSGKII